jgi:RNA polymerase sigma-70 factor, ECF subfamily
VQFESFDDAYLERLRSGDFRTQEHFVSYFSELIHLKLRSRIRTPHAVEDVRQETFVRVFAALQATNSIRQPDRLGSFVNSICNNVLLEHYRSSSRASSIEEEDNPDPPDERTDILGSIHSKQLEEQIRRVLDELPERDRRIIQQVFLEERDKDEICRNFGVDRDYLRVLLHRAKFAFKSVYLKQLKRRAANTSSIFWLLVLQEFSFRM